MKSKYSVAIWLVAGTVLAGCDRHDASDVVTKSDMTNPAGATASSPVAAAMRASVAEVRAGEPLEIAVQVRIKPGWHIYAVNRPAGSSLPTSIGLDLPAGVERAGDWELPEAALEISTSDQPRFIYTGDVEFRCRLRVSQDAQAGTLKLAGVLNFQACDRFSCQPPDSIPLATEVRVVP